MSEPFHPQLEQYRAEIDECDQALIKTLALRFGVVRKVAELKVAENMEAVQPVRAQAVKDRAVAWGQAEGLDAGFMKMLYDLLIDHAHDLEHDIIDQAK